MIQSSKKADEVDKLRAEILLEYTNWVGCASHSSATSAEKVQIPESEKYVGVSLTLCECGNDTFRLIETADWLFDYEEWEGDDTLRICTKCGKSLGCIHEVRTHKNITRESLAELRAQQKGEREQG
jgi:hypothetical protein